MQTETGLCENAATDGDTLKMKKVLAIKLIVVCLFFVGCSKPEIGQIDSKSKILAFGDSITAGYGVSGDKSYPSVLESLIGCSVLNSGVSGEATAEGLKRLPGQLKKHNPDLVILCLGGNDMLGKYPLPQVKSNLKTMIELIKADGCDVILVGVPKPGLLLSVPDLYEELSDDFEIPYEGDVLTDVLSKRSLKSDHIHPNEKGYRLIAERLSALIKESER